jgi:hypothetical protein
MRQPWQQDRRAPELEGTASVSDRAAPRPKPDTWELNNMTLLRRLFGKAQMTELANREFGALIAGATTMAHDLENVLEKIKLESVIDVKQLIADIESACKQATETYNDRLSNSNESGTTRWNAENYAKCVEPHAHFLVAPKNIVDATVEAVRIGETNVDDIAKLMVLELETALQRWRVAFAVAMRWANPDHAIDLIDREIRDIAMHYARLKTDR